MSVSVVAEPNDEVLPYSTKVLETSLVCQDMTADVSLIVETDKDVISEQ